MISNAYIYRYHHSAQFKIDLIESHLTATAFQPCGAQQERSIGFVPPREEHGALIESVGGQWIMKIMIETKSVPGPVVKRKAQETIDQIVATTGRKPGKKESKEIREDALMALLPMAFTNQSGHLIWLDPMGTLVIDASSQTKADEVVTALITAIPDLGVRPLNTQTAPQVAMTQWLVAKDPDEWPERISVERGCELKSSDQEKSVVRFTRHNLLNDEVRQHIAQGKLPTRLALSWDGRVGFMLTEGGQLKGIEYLDGVYSEQDANKADGFDADVAIMTGELSKLIADLVEALGGEIVDSPAPTENGEPAANDPEYLKAVALVKEQKKASISLVQRHLQIGYNRAARMVEQMEIDHIVSPADSSGSRRVIAA